jgi:hypothetical protein
MRLSKRDPHAPYYYSKMPTQKATAWDSSKGCIFRIKFPLHFTAARVAVCLAIASSYPLHSFKAGQQGGPLATQE